MHSLHLTLFKCGMGRALNLEVTNTGGGCNNELSFLKQQLIITLVNIVCLQELQSVFFKHYPWIYTLQKWHSVWILYSYGGRWQCWFCGHSYLSCGRKLGLYYFLAQERKVKIRVKIRVSINYSEIRKLLICDALYQRNSMWKLTNLCYLFQICKVNMLSFSGTLVKSDTIKMN